MELADEAQKDQPPTIVVHRKKEIINQMKSHNWFGDVSAHDESQSGQHLYILFTFYVVCLYKSISAL